MEDVFTKRKGLKPTFNVGVLLNNKEKPGEIGIEIECEGNKFPIPDGYQECHSPVSMSVGGFDLPYWSYVHDGSLRGKANAEYLLTNPVLFSEVPVAIKSLFDALKKYGTKLDDSNRTSVHIHLNCQRFHFDRLTSFMGMYFALEEVLTQWAGEHREGNLFCLRATDAPAIVTHIKKFLKADGIYQFNDGLHYAGLNPQALMKHGSLEIRTLRGVTDPQVILDWVKIFERLYTLSGEMSDPRDVCGRFSCNGPLAFFYEILGDTAKIVREGISWDNEQIVDSMYKGIRLAQDLCYCRDWGEYRAIQLDADPFNRDIKKIAKKLLSDPSAISGMAIGDAIDTLDLVSEEMLTSVPGWLGPSSDETSGEYYEPEPEYDDEGIHVSW